MPAVYLMMALAKKVRLGWMFDWERQFSFTVDLPVEATMEILSKAITEPSSMYRRYWETVRGSRKWFENPYGGTVWKEFFRLARNNIGRECIALQIGGSAVAESNATRVNVRTTVPSSTKAAVVYALSMLFVVTIFWIASLTSFLVGRGRFQDTVPALCALPAFALFALLLPWSHWNSFRQESVNAEKWFKTTYGPHGIQIVSELIEGVP